MLPRAGLPESRIFGVRQSDIRGFHRFIFALVFDAAGQEYGLAGVRMTLVLAVRPDLRRAPAPYTAALGRRRQRPQRGTCTRRELVAVAPMRNTRE